MPSVLSYFEPRNWDNAASDLFNTATNLGPLVSLIPGTGSWGAGLTALNQILGGAQASKQVGRIGDQQNALAQQMLALGLPAYQIGLQSLIEQLQGDLGSPAKQEVRMMGRLVQKGQEARAPSNLEYANPYLSDEALSGAMENVERDFGIGASAAQRRFGGRGLTGSSGLYSALANQGNAMGAARGQARRDLLVQGNMEGYRRARLADAEKFQRAQALGNFGTGLMSSGMGTLGGLQGLYASQAQGYGSGLSQLLSNPDLAGLLKPRRGQGGGTTSPTSTTSQAPSRGPWDTGAGIYGARPGELD